MKRCTYDFGKSNKGVETEERERQRRRKRERERVRKRERERERERQRGREGDRVLVYSDPFHPFYIF